MVWKEGAPIQPAQKRLEGNPGQKCVQFLPACRKPDIDLSFPIVFCLLQGFLNLMFRAVSLCDPFYLLLVFCNANQNRIGYRLPGPERDLRECQPAHRLSSRNFRSCGNTRLLTENRAGMREAAAFSNQRIHGREKGNRRKTIPGKAHDIVNLLIFPVPFLIKGHRRLHLHAMLRCPDPVQHGSYVPVIP